MPPRIAVNELMVNCGWYNVMTCLTTLASRRSPRRAFYPLNYRLVGARFLDTKVSCVFT